MPSCANGAGVGCGACVRVMESRVWLDKFKGEKPVALAVSAKTPR